MDTLAVAEGVLGLFSLALAALALEVGFISPETPGPFCEVMAGAAGA